MPPLQPSTPTGRPLLKFGGAALSDGLHVRRACAIVAELAAEGPIAVVSAPAGVTALLEEVAQAAAVGRREGERVRIRLRTLLRQLDIESELLDRQLGQLFRVLDAVAERGELDPASRDFALSIGERASARIFARALHDSGLEAAPVDSFDLGLLSDSNHGRARPVPESSPALRAALEAVPGVPVITGFLAADRRGNVTTLGPNGSDWTAALVAEAVGAARVEFWKPVDGVFTADPNEVPEARLVARLDYDQAAAMARAGASVLHPDALQPLRRAHIPALLRNIGRPRAAGTTIGDDPAPRPVGVALRRGLYRWSFLDARAAAWKDVLRARRLDPWAVEAESARAQIWTFAPAAAPREVDGCAGPFALVALVGADLELGRAALATAEARVEVGAAWLGAGRESQVLAVPEEDGVELARVLHGLLEQSASPVGR